MDNEEIYMKTVAEGMATTLDEFRKSLYSALYHDDYNEIITEKDFIKRKVFGTYTDEIIRSYFS